MIKEKKSIILFFILIAILFIFVESTSTSFLYKYIVGMDSPIFIIIGKYWNNNFIPYVNLFDHKGPIIFFIDMIGFNLFKNVSGIMVLQIISMFFTIVGLFKIIKLKIQSNKKSIVITLISICTLFLTYTEGNLTEEYCLPFIVFCLYLNLKFFNEKNDNLKHNYLYSLFYGISFSICFLTRITNAISICCGVFIIFIILLKNKQYKNIIINALFFLIGFLIMLLPFVIYFYLKDALYDFLYGTILYNFKYQSNTVHWWKEANPLKELIRFLVYFFPTYALVIFSIIYIYYRSNNYNYYFYVFLGVIETIFFLLGRVYPHYAMICLPNMAIMLTELNSLKVKEIFQKIMYVILIMYFIISLFYMLYKLKNNYIDSLSVSPTAYETLIELIPDNEKDSFIGYNTNANIYLWFDLKPAYKHFILQEFQSQNDENMKKEIYDEFNEGSVKWILTQSKVDIIENILEKRYHKVEEVMENNVKYVLYNINMEE